MTRATRSGDIRAALRYAAMLPTGRDAARESIVIASGNRDAVRRWLLDRAAEPGADRPAIAQRLLEGGFRSDSIALLRQPSRSEERRVRKACGRTCRSRSLPYHSTKQHQQKHQS